MASDNGTEIRVLAATGVCGSGFHEASLAEAMRRQPHFIGCDCGSTDPGPYPLGAGTMAFPRVAMKRDLRLMLLAARQAGIPLLLGSAGTAGGVSHVAVVKDLLTEIAAEAGLSFSLALIQAEQDKTYLKQRLREGRIKPLKPAPSFDEVVIDRSTRIVGMMGSEPYLRALDNGAEVVLAGRSIDTAIFAGIPAGIAWHAAKILECGAASAEQRTSPDCLMATCRADHVDVEPRDPTLRCTPQSIASHSRHENADSCTSASTSRSSTSELISWGCATSFGQWRSWDRAMYVCSTTCWGRPIGPNPFPSGIDKEVLPCGASTFMRI